MKTDGGEMAGSAHVNLTTEAKGLDLHTWLATFTTTDCQITRDCVYLRRKWLRNPCGQYGCNTAAGGSPPDSLIDSLTDRQIDRQIDR